MRCEKREPNMSNRPKRRTEEPTPSGDFVFNPSDLDLRFSRNLLTVLDGYRIQRTYDLGFIDKAVGKGEVPRSFIKQWPTMRTLLHRLAAIGPDLPGVESSMNRKQYLSFASMATLTVVAPMILLTWVLRWDFLIGYIVPLTVLAIGLVLINWLASAWVNRSVAWKIYNYVEANPNLVEKERAQLKVWVQTLIDHIERLMRKTGADPDKFPTKFFNDDYRGIEVLKVPAGLRKHYTVRFKVAGPD